jgi:hypothetical protein
MCLFADSLSLVYSNGFLFFFCRLFPFFVWAASSVISISHALDVETDLLIDGGPDGW